MNIRTSTYGQNQKALNQLMAQQNKLFELQQQADSKKKVNTLSDNPTEISTVMNLNNQLAQIQSYYKNIDSAKNQLNTLDTTFDETTKKLDRIHDLGLQLLNQTGSPETIAATKDEINQLIESVVDTANKDYNGEYIFSGSKVGTAPYTIERDPDSGSITGITYHGSAQNSEGAEKKLEISNGVKVGVNATGDKVFGSYSAGPPEVAVGLFGELGKLSNATYPDLTAITTDLQTSMAAAGASAAEITVAVDAAVEAAKKGFAQNPAKPDIDGINKAITDALVGSNPAIINAAVTSATTAANNAAANFTTNLEGAMKGLEAGMKDIAATRSTFGARSSRLELTKSSLEDLELSTTAHKSSIVDLDMVEALSNLVQQNYAYQASMSTYSMLQQNSLLNYLK